MNEVCQLNVSESQETDGIWAMNLNADSEDKSIKTWLGGLGSTKCGSISYGASNVWIISKCD